MANLDLQGDKAFWDKIKKTASPIVKRKLIDEAGIRALRFSKERFRQKNWVDKNMPTAWDKRKKKARGSILVQSGRLKRSIRITAKGRYFVEIGTDVPYAKIHNEGGKITQTVTVKAHKRTKSIAKSSNIRSRKASRQRVKAGTTTVREHSRKMNLSIPQRQFLGESSALARKIEKQMKKIVDNHLK
jgi:phage gpG-like protein